MKYNQINMDFDDFRQFVADGNKISDILLKHYQYPPEIKELIKTNHKIVKAIIDFYHNDFKLKLQIYTSFSITLSNLEFVKIPDGPTKLNFIEFNKIILPWLKQCNFFNEIYREEIGTEANENSSNTSDTDKSSSDIASNDTEIDEVNDITEGEIMEYAKNIQPITNFVPRINQKEAFELLERDGLITGIHCQATGCGKTYIILKYIDYAGKKCVNPKIILFTERVSILADLFEFQKGISSANINNIIKWKQLGICDLTKFEIINRVTIKKKDWCDLVIKSVKPTLLVINRAFLTLGKQYTKFSENVISLVIHDECHNTSSAQCHEFLTKCKLMNVPIVGFSATPLRTGKHDKPKLLEIYAKSSNKNELNLLTDYNMIYAISNNLILPPEFYWYQIKSQKSDEKNSSDGDVVTNKNISSISVEDVSSVLEMLNHIVPKLPNKKIVAWCGTISLAKKWKSSFEKYCKEKSNMKTIKFGLDTSEKNTGDYDIFRKVTCNMILFCANKHREGSDIKYLDCCIFLDKVKDRGAIPLIQSIGRVLRVCPNTKNKKKGVVIDGFIKNDKEYEKMFVDKIIGYYMALKNLTNSTLNEKSKYEQYVEMKNIVEFDKKNELIKMKLCDKTIDIHCNKLEWENIVNKYDKLLQEKIKLGTEENFIHKAQILKNKFNFCENSDFIKEYAKIKPDEKIKYGLPDINSEEYIKLFAEKTWYDFLELKPKFYKTPKIAVNALLKANINIINPEKNWDKWLAKDHKLPPYPKYFWKDFDWSKFCDEDDDILF